MRINVPSPEESKKEKRKKSLRFIKGSIIGIVFFGLCSFGLFWNGVGEVEVHTWIALGFGVLSFGFFGMYFGSDFLKNIF